MNYRRRPFDPATFDPERGENLTVPHELIIPMAKADWMTTGQIFHSLFRWMAGEDEDAVKMENPFAQMFLTQLIEHQKTNAANYYDGMMKKSESGRKAGLASAAKRSNGKQQPSTPVNGCQRTPTKYSKEEDKEEDKVPEGEGLYLSSVPETGTATPCAEGLCVTAAPGDVATIHPYADDEPIEVAHVALQKDPVGVMLDFLNPPAEERAKTQNALAARMRDATRVTFDAVCWKFLKEAETATTRRKDAEAKIRAQMAKEGIEDRETLLDKYPDAKARWDKVCETADTFDPGDGAAKTLFGRLKAYKPKQEKPDRKGDGE